MGPLGNAPSHRTGIFSTGRPKNACIVAHTHFIRDSRVRREAEMLLSDGWSLDAICLREPGDPAIEWWNGVRVIHLPGQRHHGSNLLNYFQEYLTFFVSAMLTVCWLTVRRRYSLVHVHNLPDFLVFTAVLPRALGARVILDIHDPLPDLYLSKFGGDQRRLAVRVARGLERVSTSFANHVLVPGEPSRRRLIGRGVPPEKVTNILNSADPEIFRPHGRAVDDSHFTLVYHGSLFKRYGLDIAIRAVHLLRDAIPGLRLRIAGNGEEAENLQQLVEQLNLSDHVTISRWLPMEEIVKFVAEADLGVVPYRRDTFTDLIYPTKAFECIAMGVPVIMSELAGIAELFPHTPDIFFAPDNVDALAQHILRLYREPDRLRRLNDALQDAYAPYSLDVQREQYLALVDRLLSGRDRQAHAAVGSD